MQSKIRVIKKAKKNNSRNLFCYLYTFFHQWAKYLNRSSMCHSLLYQASSSLKPWISCYNGGGVRVRGACHFRTLEKKWDWVRLDLWIDWKRQTEHAVGCVVKFTYVLYHLYWNLRAVRWIVLRCSVWFFATINNQSKQKPREKGKSYSEPG